VETGFNWLSTRPVVAGCCEHGNELYGSIKDGEFRDELLKKFFAPYSEVVKTNGGSKRNYGI
jgi:hypothetical protein